MGGHHPFETRTWQGRHAGGPRVKGRKSNSRGCGASAVAQERPVSRIYRFPTLWFRGARAIRRSSGAGRVLASLVARARGTRGSGERVARFWV